MAMAEMAMKSSVTTAKLTLPPSSSSCKKRARQVSVALPTTTSISLLSVFSSPPPEAKAAVSISKDQIVSSLTEVEKTINQVQETGSSVFDATQRVFQVVGDALKPALDTALPIAKQAGEEALKLASPAFSEASKKAQEAMQSSGIDAEPVFNAAKTVTDVAQQTTKALEDAKPIASSTMETISSADPSVVVVAAGAAFIAYLLIPPVWSAISFNFRGYKGDLTPAQTLDLLCSKNYLMVDIRSEKEKEKAGIPRLPSNAKNSMIAIPLEELPNKVKGIVRNSKRVEAEIAALKISYLKRINKGSNIIIMDSYSDYPPAGYPAPHHSGHSSGGLGGMIAGAAGAAAAAYGAHHVGHASHNPYGHAGHGGFGHVGHASHGYGGHGHGHGKFKHGKHGGKHGGKFKHGKHGKHGMFGGGGGKFKKWK